MRGGFITLVSISTLLLVLSGCSVSLQSNQYTFIKELLTRNGQQEKLPENWVVLFQGRTYPAFAVNHQGGTFFANDKGLFVSFDGWQVTQFSFHDGKRKKDFFIKSETNGSGTFKLEYSDGRRNPISSSCQPWVRIGTGWTQECLGAKGALSRYSNVITLNVRGELVSLYYLVSPDSSPTEIKLI
ncbi:MAG: hypothetical protein CMD99_07245 [Gammaproteobacteria bacterium]|nr:hypothetical protein [Gammaproteobacteria bacterium]